MSLITNPSLSYYFLNPRLHRPTPSGYRNSIILLLINKNATANKNKYLLIRQYIRSWGLPKEGIKSKNIVDDIFTTIARNLDEEQGFRGLKVIETKAQFKQLAILFDFAKQVYDHHRSKDETQKNRPNRGKIYHLAIIEYQGSDKIPLLKDPKNKETIDYRWVNEKEGRKLLRSNWDLVSKKQIKSKTSMQFNIDLFNKAVSAYHHIHSICLTPLSGQKSLFLS